MTPQDFSLDDAAALLVQLEPSDTAELGRLKTGLEDLAFEGGLPPLAQARVAGAARRVGEALAGEGDAAREALAQAGRMIEEAMNAVYGVGAAPVAPVAPESPATPEEAERLIEEAIQVLGRAPAEHEMLPPLSVAEAERAAEEALDLLAKAAAPAAPAAPATDEFSLAEVDTSLLADFLTESREYMEGAEASLLALEMNPEDAESINTVFRAFHTIKGTSAFLGLEPVSELAHHAESLFNRFRDGEIRCTGRRADVSLRAVDVLSALLRNVEQTPVGEPLLLPEGYQDLLHVLKDPAAAGLLREDEDGEDAYDATDADEESEPQAPKRLGDILVEGGKADPEKLAEALANKGDKPLGLALVQSKAASLTDVAQALRKQQQRSGSAESTAEASVRVRTDRLDRLVDMVGELVVAHSMLAQDPTVLGDAYSLLGRKVSQAGKIVRELQDLSVGMRMVPLRATFQKMSRLVRDVARKSGKQVEFITEGDDTEIDRSMVDLIGDPLVHMIRNAVDHGIERPEEREAQGKPRTGTVRLSAFHSSGNVVIELQDDGRGLNRDKIVQKAVAKGLIDGEKTLPDSEVFRLIFAPGFSTADQVTDLSGRGVGMDVVKRNIEAVNGRVDIASESGAGSIFTIRLPLTLAVTDGMLVRVAEERYILPTVNIQMSFRPRREMISTVAGRGELVLLRGDLLPIVRLHRLFDVTGAVADPTEALLVVVGFGDKRCALLVDELLGQQQVVAKSLGEGLGRVPGVAGGAVLGDGQIGLILDVAEVISIFQQVAA